LRKSAKRLKIVLGKFLRLSAALREAFSHLNKSFRQEYRMEQAQSRWVWKKFVRKWRWLWTETICRL